MEAQVTKRKAYGELKSPFGSVLIKNKAVARALEEAYETTQALGRLREAHQRTLSSLEQERLRLAKLQNHWWTRLGEFLRIVTVVG